MTANNPILEQLGRYLSDTLQMELLNTGHIASEALFNSIESVVERTLSGVEISVGGLFYAKYVNAGRKAGMKGIPLDVLTEWIRRRKIDLRGRREESAAFAMQTSIKERGIHPAPLIDRAVRKIGRSAKADALIERYMAQFIDQQMQTIFNQLSA